MPIRAILLDNETVNKVNQLSEKYNLSALIKSEILRQFSDKKVDININIKKMRGRQGGMLRGRRMNIYLDNETDQLLYLLRNKEKFNFSKFCREIFQSIEEK